MTDILTASQLDQPVDVKPPIAVAARIRPSLPNEPKTASPTIFCDNNEIVTQDPATKLQTRHEFDQVYGPSCSNIDCFDRIKPYLYDVLCGTPFLQMNYGITSAGKSFTLLGNLQQPGILQQSINYLFEQISNSDIASTAVLKLSGVQLYMNQSFDLITKQQLKISGISNDPYPDRSWSRFSNMQEFQQVLNAMVQNREVCSTNNNTQSSRSHCIYTITIQNGNEGNCCCFVDLAGSEPHQQGASKLIVQESSFIRTSLLMLDRAIRDLKTLTNNGRCVQSVSFRSSVLTMALKPFLAAVKRTENQYSMPGQIFLFLNLHANLVGFQQNKETLHLGLLTKNIKNYQTTVSRLGQLGHSVQNLVGSVMNSQIDGMKTTRGNRSKANIVQEETTIETAQIDENYVVIPRLVWDEVLLKLQQFGDETLQMQAELEEADIRARQEVVDEMRELMEAQIMQERYEMEQRIADLELQLKLVSKK